MSSRISAMLGIVFYCMFTPLSQLCAARSVVITTDKGSLKGDEVLTITASISGFLENEQIRVKGVFHQDGASNYFGYTKYADNWIKCGDSTASQMEVALDTWDKMLTVKADFGDSGFKGEGEYRVKLGYYYKTSSGSYASVSWSNALSVNINEPDPTATILPTQTIVPTPQSTQIPLPSSTPVSTLVPTKAPTHTVFSLPSLSEPLPTIQSSKRSIGIVTNKTHLSLAGNILGTHNEDSADESVHATVSANRILKKNLSTAMAFIGMGLAVLSIVKTIELSGRWKEL